MDAVIVAAGRGTRMRPLTDTRPKPMVPVAGKPILQHTVDLLRDHVDRIVVVAGYRMEAIEEHFAGTDVEIVEQSEPLGTAHAALQARGLVEGKTLIVNGDDVYDLDVAEIEAIDRGIVAARADDPTSYGVLDVAEDDPADDTVRGVEEKPDDPATDLVNTGFYVVQEDFFALLEDTETSERGEYEITDAVERYVADGDFAYVEADHWTPCSYPWHLLDANRYLLEARERRVDGDVAASASLHGTVVVEAGATVRENVVVDGPALIQSGATVGPNAYVRGATTIGPEATVGNAVEVKNSLLLPGATAGHLSYVGDSILGADVNFGAGTVVANLRHDDANVRMRVKGEAVDTGRRKLGVVLGDRAKTGIDTSLNAGVVLGVGTTTGPGETVTRDRGRE